MKLDNLSIRARVAFGIKCLEQLIEKESNTNFNWDEILLSKLWEYTHTSDLGQWHYLISEFTPFSVLEDIPFEEKECEYIQKSEHNELQRMYQKSSAQLQRCVNLIFEIGTLDLYSSIVDKSPRTLLMIQEIIQIMEANSLKLPNIEKYMDYTINDQQGWGVKFYKSDIE